MHLQERVALRLSLSKAVLCQASCAIACHVKTDSSVGIGMTGLASLVPQLSISVLYVHTSTIAVQVQRDGAHQGDRQEAKDGLIRSFRYKGSVQAGSTNLSPASSGVGKSS